MICSNICVYECEEYPVGWCCTLNTQRFPLLDLVLLQQLFPMSSNSYLFCRVSRSKHWLYPLTPSISLSLPCNWESLKQPIHLHLRQPLSKSGVSWRNWPRHEENWTWHRSVFIMHKIMVDSSYLPLYQVFVM